MASVRFWISSGLSPVTQAVANAREPYAREHRSGRDTNRRCPCLRPLLSPRPPPPRAALPWLRRIKPRRAADRPSPSSLRGRATPTPRSRGDCLLVRRSHDCEDERPSAGSKAMGVGDADAVEATTPCGHDVHSRGARRSRTAILAACRSSHVTVDPSSSAPHGAAGGAGRPRAGKFSGHKNL